MPTGLKRYQANRDAHFVTLRCYRREPRLAEPGAYETFARALEQARKRHGLLVYGYVLMPEHVHLLTARPPLPTRHQRVVLDDLPLHTYARECIVMRK